MIVRHGPPRVHRELVNGAATASPAAKWPSKEDTSRHGGVFRELAALAQGTETRVMCVSLLMHLHGRLPHLRRTVVQRVACRDFRKQPEHKGKNLPSYCSGCMSEDHEACRFLGKCLKTRVVPLSSR